MTQNEILLSVTMLLLIIAACFLIKEVYRFLHIAQNLEIENKLLKQENENYKLRLENPIDKVMFPKLEEMFRNFGEATNEKDS